MRNAKLGVPGKPYLTGLKDGKRIHIFDESQIQDSYADGYQVILDKKLLTLEEAIDVYRCRIRARSNKTNQSS